MLYYKVWVHVMKGKSRRSPKDWAVWLETKLVNGYYPPDKLSKKALFLYVAMVRRSGLKPCRQLDGAQTTETAWLTMMAKNAYCTDTGLPIDTYQIALQELIDKHFVRPRPELLPTPVFLKGIVYEILPCPRYDPDEGFVPVHNARDLKDALEDTTGIQAEIGERPVTFFPASLVDLGYLKRLRTARLLRVALWLYGIQRLDTDMGIPEAIIQFTSLASSGNPFKNVVLPNLNHFLDPNTEPSAGVRLDYLNRMLTSIHPGALRALNLGRHEVQQALMDLVGLDLVHFAIVERYSDQEDPDIQIRTVINAIDNRPPGEKSLLKRSRYYHFNPRSKSDFRYICQMAIKPHTAETARYLARIAETTADGHVVKTSETTESAEE